MKASELVAEVTGTVNGGGGFTPEEVLGYINRGLKSVSKLLLPWLEGGSGTVTTDGTVSVSLPEDFSLNLYSAATEENGPVRILTSKKALADYSGGVIKDTDNGSVEAVCISGRSLFYQQVPTDPTNIDIMYYMKHPELKADDTVNPLWNEFDDGVGFDDLLIHFASWKMFAIIERGEEGPKKNTLYHKGEYQELYDSLELRCVKEGRSYVTPQHNKTW